MGRPEARTRDPRTTPCWMPSLRRNVVWFPAPTVADGRHPGVEGPPHVVRRAQQANGVVVAHVDVFATPSIARHIRMRVAVNQPWQERCGGEAEGLPVQRASAGSRTHRRDRPPPLSSPRHRWRQPRRSRRGPFRHGWLAIHLVAAWRHLLAQQWKISTCAARRHVKREAPGGGGGRYEYEVLG